MSHDVTSLNDTFQYKKVIPVLYLSVLLGQLYTCLTGVSIPSDCPVTFWKIKQIYTLVQGTTVQQFTDSQYQNVFVKLPAPSSVIQDKGIWTINMNTVPFTDKKL